MQELSHIRQVTVGKDVVKHFDRCVAVCDFDSLGYWWKDPIVFLHLK